MLEDIRHAMRLYRRTPAAALIALASIAITVGATAVVFAAVKSVLIDPLPYSNSAALVQFRTDYSRGVQSRADWVSWDDMQEVARRNRTLESLGTYDYALFNLTGDATNPPEALYGLRVSTSMFPALGVRPIIGRNITPDEERTGQDREMILSYGLWTRRFNSDPKVVGRSVEVNGHECTIIGVMPRGFDFPMRLATTVRTPSGHMDFWAPEAPAPRDQKGYGAVARLKAGISLEQAQADLDSISPELERLFPRHDGDRELRLIPLTNQVLGFAKPGLLLLMGAAAIFMLIGCANVANLLLARALARHREIAVRLALGARPKRIVRQLVTESCLLALSGGVAGYGLAVLAWALLPAVAPTTVPRLEAARADTTVLAFSLAVSILNGILFGLAPALRSSHRDPAISLRESASRGSVGSPSGRLRSALVVSEVALAVILVIVGGLLSNSFVRLLLTDPGFDTHVLASIIAPTGDQYKKPENREPLFRCIIDAVRLQPGVESVGSVDALPFSGENNGGFISAGDRGPNDPGLVAEIDRVSADYLQTMGVRLLDGRWFAGEDMQASRDTAIISEDVAKRLWPERSAIGKRLCVNCANEKARQWKRVVGVVSGVRHAGLDQPLGGQVYYATNAYQHSQFLVVRTRRPSPEMSQAIRRAVATVDPKQPVFLSASMSSLIGDSIADRRFILTLLATTGILALLLSAAGLYGVISYTNSLRTQEIGVRIALGATPGNVLALVFRDGMILAAIGVAIGLACALAISRVLRNVLAGLADDPALIAVAVALVLVTAAIACWIPARRATRVDPMQALRQD